jgi:hypothetical protein
MIMPLGVARTPIDNTRNKPTTAAAAITREIAISPGDVRNPRPNKPSNANPARTAASAMVHGHDRHVFTPEG